MSPCRRAHSPPLQHQIPSDSQTTTPKLVQNLFQSPASSGSAGRKYTCWLVSLWNEPAIALTGRWPGMEGVARVAFSTTPSGPWFTTPADLRLMSILSFSCYTLTTTFSLKSEFWNNINVHQCSLAQTKSKTHSSQPNSNHQALRLWIVLDYLRESLDF